MTISRYFERLRRTQKRRELAETRRTQRDRMPEETAGEWAEHLARLSPPARQRYFQNVPHHLKRETAILLTNMVREAA